jgi:hypothetical protein
MAALAADLEAVRVAVQAAVEKEGSWDDGDWSVFVVDVVSFLLGKHKKQSFVVAAAVGLIVYGVTTEEELSPGQGEKPRKCAVSRVLGPMWRADAVSRVLVRAMWRAQSRNAEASARE